MSQPCGANGTSSPILAPQLLILILLFTKLFNPYKYQYFSVSLFYNLQYCILLSTTVEPLDLQKWYGRHPKMFDFWHINHCLKN